MRTGRWGELLPERGFSRSRLHAHIERAARGSRWLSAVGVQVISSQVDAVLPGTDDLVGPSWHLSVTVRDPAGPGGLRRPTMVEMVGAVDAFGLPAFEEDNHHPGAARHLWCPIDPAYRGVCECKLSEARIVEADGYEWTNPVSGPCRGCQLALLIPSRPCTIHHGAVR